MALSCRVPALTVPPRGAAAPLCAAGQGHPAAPKAPRQLLPSTRSTLCLHRAPPGCVQDLGWKHRRTALPKSQALPAPARGCLRGAGTWRGLPKCRGLAAPASASQTAPLRSPPPGAGCPVAPLWHPWAGTCMRFVTCLPPLHPCAVPTTRCSSTFVLCPLLTVQSQD